MPKSTRNAPIGVSTMASTGAALQTVASIRLQDPRNWLTYRVRGFVERLEFAHLLESSRRA